MLRLISILLFIIFLVSCQNTQANKIENQVEKNQIIDVYAYNLRYVRENPRKSDVEKYRNLIVWSWGINPYGGGAILISVGQKDTVYFVNTKECYQMSKKTDALFGECKEIYKEIDSLKFAKFSQEINQVDTRKVEKEWSSSDPHNFYFEGFPKDTSLLHGTSDDTFALELAIKFLKIIDYDKSAIQQFEQEIERINNSMKRMNKNLKTNK